VQRPGQSVFGAEPRYMRAPRCFTTNRPVYPVYTGGICRTEARACKPRVGRRLRPFTRQRRMRSRSRWSSRDKEGGGGRRPSSKGRVSAKEDGGGGSSHRSAKHVDLKESGMPSSKEDGDGVSKLSDSLELKDATDKSEIGNVVKAASASRVLDRLAKKPSLQLPRPGRLTSRSSSRRSSAESPGGKEARRSLSRRMSAPATSATALATADAVGTADTSIKRNSRQAKQDPSPEGPRMSLLTASWPLEDFFVAGLLPMSSRDGRSGVQAVLQVQPTEPIGSVVDQLHQRKVCECIVAYANGRSEFFDCLDLSTFLVEAVAGKTDLNAAALIKAAEKDDWCTTKHKLRRVAETPVSEALRLPRQEACEFRRFDASGSLEDLLRRLGIQRRVPVYRGEKLCCIVSPADILEMCCRLTEDTKHILEQMQLSDAVLKRPNIISKVEIPEEASLLEVLFTMYKADMRVAPVLASHRQADNSPTDALTNTPDSGELVGQFDIASLRAMFARGPTDGSSREWWWEESTVTTNILLEPCMDFLVRGSNRSAKTQSAYSAVLLEESLARSILRSLSSSFQSIVVHRASCGSSGVRNTNTSAPTCLRVSSPLMGLFSVCKQQDYSSLCGLIQPSRVVGRLEHGGHRRLLLVTGPSLPRVVS